MKLTADNYTDQPGAYSSSITSDTKDLQQAFQDAGQRRYSPTTTTTTNYPFGWYNVPEAEPCKAPIYVESIAIRDFLPQKDRERCIMVPAVGRTVTVHHQDGMPAVRGVVTGESLNNPQWRAITDTQTGTVWFIDFSTKKEWFYADDVLHQHQPGPTDNAGEQA